MLYLLAESELALLVLVDWVVLWSRSVTGQKGKKGLESRGVAVLILADAEAFGEDGSKTRGAYLVEFWLALLPLLFWLLSMLAWYLRYLPKKSCSAAVKEGGLALYCQPTSNNVQKYLQLRRVSETDTVNVVNTYPGPAVGYWSRVVGGSTCKHAISLSA